MHARCCGAADLAIYSEERLPRHCFTEKRSRYQQTILELVATTNLQDLMQTEAATTQALFGMPSLLNGTNSARNATRREPLFPRFCFGGLKAAFRAFRAFRVAGVAVGGMAPPSRAAWIKGAPSRERVTHSITVSRATHRAVAAINARPATCAPSAAVSGPSRRRCAGPLGTKQEKPHWVKTHSSMAPPGTLAAFADGSASSNTLQRNGDDISISEKTRQIRK